MESKLIYICHQYGILDDDDIEFLIVQDDIPMTPPWKTGIHMKVLEVGLWLPLSMCICNVVSFPMLMLMLSSS